MWPDVEPQLSAWKKHKLFFTTTSNGTDVPEWATERLLPWCVSGSIEVHTFCMNKSYFTGAVHAIGSYFNFFHLKYRIHGKTLLNVLTGAEGDVSVAFPTAFRLCLDPEEASRVNPVTRGWRRLPFACQHYVRGSVCLGRMEESLSTFCLPPCHLLHLL